MKEISSGPASSLGYSYLGCAPGSVDSSDFYGDVSWAYISSNPISGAGATWKKAFGNDYLAAWEMMRSEDYESAFNLLMNLLNDAKTANKAECLQLAMQAAKKMGSFSEQKEILTAYMSDNDKSVREASEVWQSILFEHLGEFAKAQEIVDNTTLTGESKLSMLFNLAAAYDDAGFDDKAIALFEQMIREFPEEKEEVLGYIREMNHGGGKSNKYIAETTTSNAPVSEMPTAYPNPFNATTKISYILPESGQIKIVVFNTLGQKVRTLFDGNKEAGQHEILWDGLDDFANAASSGLYLTTFITADQTRTVKIALVR